jgi:hypothetical protein
MLRRKQTSQGNPGKESGGASWMSWVACGKLLLAPSTWIIFTFVSLKCTMLGITALNAQRHCHPRAAPHSARADVGLCGCALRHSSKQASVDVRRSDTASLPNPSLHRSFSGRYRQWLHTWTGPDEVRMVIGHPGSRLELCNHKRGASPAQQATKVSFSDNSKRATLARSSHDHNERHFEATSKCERALVSHLDQTCSVLHHCLLISRLVR